MEWKPEIVGGEILVHLDASHENYIYSKRGEWVGIKDLSGNGNHMYWNKPQEKLEAFFRRIVRWLDKYIWREGSYLTTSQLNEIGNGLADRFNVNWTDIK